MICREQGRRRTEQAVPPKQNSMHTTSPPPPGRRPTCAWRSASALAPLKLQLAPPWKPQKRPRGSRVTLATVLGPAVATRHGGAVSQGSLASVRRRAAAVAPAPLPSARAAPLLSSAPAEGSVGWLDSTAGAAGAAGAALAFASAHAADQL